jgi:Calcineurin-like phosphoesterase
MPPAACRLRGAVGAFSTFGTLVLALALPAAAMLACGDDRDTKPAGAAPVPVLLHAAPERLVAIGDLHGDVEATRRALRVASAIDERDEWIGKRLVVVQTGDQLDRGDDDRATLELLERVAERAAKQGGALIVLNGNHELMNVAGDFRYVSEHSFDAYDEYSHSWLRFVGADDTGGRTAAFAPGGPVARQLAHRPVVVQVGDTLFAHGGVLPQHVRYGLDRINRETSQWVWGARAKPPEIVMAPSSPVWTRVYSDGDPHPQACALLDQVLKATGAKRMVVGHTVQRQINGACDKRVFRIDVGLARHYGGPTQVLELSGDQPRLLPAAPTP